MKFRVRDWIPTLILLILLGIVFLASVITGLSGGVEEIVILGFVVLQAFWIGIPYLVRKVAAWATTSKNAES